MKFYITLISIIMIFRNLFKKKKFNAESILVQI